MRPRELRPGKYPTSRSCWFRQAEVDMDAHRLPDAQPGAIPRLPPPPPSVGVVSKIQTL